MMTRKAELLLGILLLIAGFMLIKYPVYITVKGLFMEFSSNIMVAIALTWGTIALALAGGTALIRRV